MTEPQTSDKQATLAAMRSAGVFAVLRAPSSQAAESAIEALVRGGVVGIEVTYSTPGAVAVIASARGRYGDRIVLGAGTLTRPEQAAEAYRAGASFLVSPGTRPELATAMSATGAVTALGALTPSEVMQATELGADIVKIFPAALGGPSYLKALRGPFPDLSLMPTGGVSAENVTEWVAAGAAAVGAGSELCSASAMANERWDEITERATALIGAWRSATAGR